MTELQKQLDYARERLRKWMRKSQEWEAIAWKLASHLEAETEGCDRSQWLAKAKDEVERDYYHSPLEN